MPYIPPSAVNSSYIPKGTGRDLSKAMQYLKEKFKRFYPKIKYYMLKTNPTVEGTDNMRGDPTVTPPDTVYDSFYGEAVPSEASTKGVVQPHENTTEGDAIDATDLLKYKDMVEVNAEIRTEPTRKELDKWGIDEMKDLIVFFTTPLLDELNIIINIGDKFEWDGMPYQITEWYKKGYWKFTNIPLYIMAQAKRLRKGS